MGTRSAIAHIAANNRVYFRATSPEIISYMTVDNPIRPSDSHPKEGKTVEPFKRQRQLQMGCSSSLLSY